MAKQKIWPLPDDDFDCMCVLGNILTNRLPDSKYRIMIRKHNIAFGAIIEDTNFGVFDSQYGKKLPWMVGYLPSNNGHRFILEKYREPRYRKVPSTGEIDDPIISMNDMFIICGRNSQSLSDDDDNFTGEISENEARQVMQMRDFDSVQKIAIADLTEKLGEYRITATNLRTQADTFGREVKKLQEKVNYLQSRNLDLKDQVSEYSRQNKLLSIKKLTDESKLQAMEMGAEELGTVQGMDKMQLIEKASTDLTNVMKSFNILLKTGESQALYNDLVKKLETMLEKFKEEMKEEKKKESVPKPASKEGTK